MDTQHQFDLDRPLIDFTDSKGRSSWTIRDSFNGCAVFGGIGSGKSSGSARQIALKFLEAGYGGLVLTCKEDEKKTWQEYCRETNRLDDLVIIEPNGKNFFNFLEYESSARDDRESFTANVVHLLNTVIKANDDKERSTDNDPFWEESRNLLIYNVIDLCLLAYGKVSVQRMYDIVLSAPKAGEKSKDASGENTDFTRALEAARKIVQKNYDTWFRKQGKRRRKQLEKNPELAEQIRKDEIEGYTRLKMIDQFFVETYRTLSDKTRSIINLTFSGFLFHLLQEPVHSLFCRHPSTVTPDDCLNGKIILIDLPVKHFHKVGLYCQVLFKYIFQRAMERRPIAENDRPVFLWADEAQQFLHEHDAEYQATARSSRVATVYISQNLPNYYANMGGSKSEYLVKAFLGTMATKIFHANADAETNTYASTLIGDAYVIDNSNTVTMAGQFTSSRSESYILERMVRPEEFISLRTGGKLNDFIVSAYIHRQGQPFHTRFNHLKVSFKQQH